MANGSDWAEGWQVHGFELQVEALPLQTAETGAAQAEAGFSPGPQAVFMSSPGGRGLCPGMLGSQPQVESRESRDLNGFWKPLPKC